MRGNQIPNTISLLRMFLVPPVVWLLLQGEYGFALLLFALAGISDALDGYLAKRYHWSSRLGSILDPLADKLLLVSAYLTLGWLGQIPVWLAALVVGRDLVIVCGALIYHVRFGRFDFAPTFLSKLNTLAQILLIFSVLLIHSLLPLPPWVINGLAYIVLITTLMSGIGYVWTWGNRAFRVRRGQTHD
ncbi:MAG: CDP-alcohol phosphatidyltransferase family protein [Gammaproteobacteria bacterium]